MENECIEKALNGTELVPEYYVELTHSMCGDSACVTVSVPESGLPNLSSSASSPVCRKSLSLYSVSCHRYQD